MLKKGKEKREIKWRVPNKNGEWDRVPVKKVPTHFLIITLKQFDKKGLSKVESLVTGEKPWVIDYITELEEELKKRTDVDEYL